MFTQRDGISLRREQTISPCISRIWPHAWKRANNAMGGTLNLFGLWSMVYKSDAT
jgi:hypothetical protein